MRSTAPRKPLAGLRDFRARLGEAKTTSGMNEALHEATACRRRANLKQGMDDDLNTSVALAAIHNLTRVVNTAPRAERKCREENKVELVELLKRFDTVLNIFGDEQQRNARQRNSEFDRRTPGSSPAPRLCSAAMRFATNSWAACIILEDTKDGVRWKRK